ncbi:MAG: ABC transporter permease [Firmicutes bacterium]|nr:ABC transporter permease [Bacillota bacterium]
MAAFESFVAERYLKTRQKGAFVRTLMRYARWGIALGVFVLVVAQALMNGFREEIQANLFAATGHFTVFFFSGDLPDTSKALSTLRALPQVKAASAMRFERGLLKSQLEGAPVEAVAVKGIDPTSARGTSNLLDSLAPKPLEQLQEGELLVGKDLARSVGLRVGDRVSIAFMRLDLGLSGLQPRLVGFKVAGIFESHNGEYDQRWVFIHLNDAKRLAATDQAEFIEVRAQNIDSIEEAKTAAMSALNGAGKGPYGSTDLRDTNRALFSALKFQRILFMLILALIVVLAAFNIVAILVLFITEKRRDLGVLLALGATPRQIQRIFEHQGVRICLVGTAWGLGLALPTCWVLDHWKLVKLPPSLYDFITYVPFKLAVIDVVMVAIFPLLVAWFASRYPARRAARMNPVDALRAE